MTILGLYPLLWQDRAAPEMLKIPLNSENFFF